MNLLSFGAWSFVCSAALVAGVAHAADKVERNGDQFITFTTENDKFGPKAIDRHYTNGFRGQYTRLTDEAPSWVQTLGEILPLVDVGGKTAVTYGLNHAIYTPDNVERAAPSPGDMPYSGYLFGTLGIADIDPTRTDQYELAVGVVGPAAGGKFVQRKYHDLTGIYKPNGWKYYHLENEPTLNVSWVRRHRGYAAWDNGTWFADFEPRYGFAAGNVHTHANAGATVRFGPSRARGEDTVGLMVPGLPGTNVFENNGSGFNWFTFVSADGRAVARNIFLDGNTFSDSPSVDKKILVADFATGLVVTTGDFRGSFTLNQRTREFDRQPDRDIFGSISVGYRF
jgi:lipid A 3-O-deacylase